MTLWSLGPVVLLPPVLFLLGLYFLRAGSQRRKGRGTAPHCRACGYNLTGLTSERCPECGAVLTPQSIQRGQPTRSASLMVVGALLLAGSLALTVGLGRRVDWYQYKPAGWVISDLEGKTPMRAWLELRRRISNDSLNTEQKSRLVAVSLRLQGSLVPPAFAGELRDVVIEWLFAGMLSAAEAREFFEQMSNLKPTFSAKMTKRGVSIAVSYSSKTPSRLWSILDLSKIMLDGQVPLTGGTIAFCGGGGGGTGFLFSGPVSREHPQHMVECRMRFRLYAGPSNGPGGVIGPTTDIEPHIPLSPDKRGRLLHDLEIPFQAPIEIEPEPPQHPVRRRQDPSLLPAMTSSITPYDFFIGRSQGSPAQLTGRLSARYTPSNYAFDVFVRVDNQEYPIGYGVFGRPGQTLDFGLVLERQLRPTPTCDVILRSNERLVIENPEIFEIWDGELIYKDVPVRLGLYAHAASTVSK